MYSKETIIKNPSGLHARPASEFVQKAEVQPARRENPSRIQDEAPCVSMLERTAHQ